MTLDSYLLQVCFLLGLFLIGLVACYVAEELMSLFKWRLPTPEQAGLSERLLRQPKQL